MNTPLFELTKHQRALEEIHVNILLSGLNQIAVWELVVVDNDGLELRIHVLHNNGSNEKEVKLTKEIYLRNPGSYSRNTFSNYASQLRREHPGVFGENLINWVLPTSA